MNRSEENDMTVVTVEPTAVESINRAEIDIQIATANKYRRDITRFKEEALSMATIDEETAESCFYALPRGGKNIEGPSIRLAEIAKACYRNIKTGYRIIAEDTTTVTAQGFCYDLERNVSTAIEVTRRITDKNGKRYNDDMVAVTKNAAGKIAERNAIFAVIPRAYINSIYNAAKAVAIGDASTLQDRVQKMIAYYAHMGVVESKVLALIGKPGIDDVTLSDLEFLTGVKTAIKEGDLSIDTAFNGEQADDGKTRTERLADMLKKDQKVNVQGTPTQKKGRSTVPASEPVDAEIDDSQNPPADDGLPFPASL
jgi:hypothetical protein